MPSGRQLLAAWLLVASLRSAAQHCGVSGEGCGSGDRYTVGHDEASLLQTLYVPKTVAAGDQGCVQHTSDGKCPPAAIFDVTTCPKVSMHAEDKANEGKVAQSEGVPAQCQKVDSIGDEETWYLVNVPDCNDYGECYSYDPSCVELPLKSGTVVLLVNKAVYNSQQTNNRGWPAGLLDNSNNKELFSDSVYGAMINIIKNKKLVASLNDDMWYQLQPSNFWKIECDCDSCVDCPGTVIKTPCGKDECGCDPRPGQPCWPAPRESDHRRRRHSINPEGFLKCGPIQLKSDNVKSTWKLQTVDASS